MLAIFPLQDWIALDKKLRRQDRNVERINYPADSENHWKFRIHFPLEELSQQGGLNAVIEGLLKDSARYSYKQEEA